MKKLLLYPSILALLIISQFASAQITIVPGCTATTLANKLAGPGVTIISPTLTCAANANGTFMGTSTLSFDSGIVLTNGTAQTTLTVNGCNGAASLFASTSNGTPGDAQLTALSGHPTFDACVLQFDFKPIGDTLKFQYVFGSEEYTSFTCTVFNDVFGFFISGPGFGGPTNIALVPGTNIPVCVNSVNCGPTGGGTLSACNALGPGSPFCAYYVNNSSGSTITYDGLTTTLTAIAPVTPCDTYHLKLGIADAVDQVLDSGVFLKAGSLNSISIKTTTLGINPADTGFGAQYCVRGCRPGMFVFHNTGSLSDSIDIHFLISGTAVNGYDYSTIADSVIIPAHDSVDTLFIHGLLVPPSGTKTVKLLILSPYPCGGVPVILDSVELSIYDSFALKILTPDTAICIGQSATINTMGDPHLHFQWTPNIAINNDTLLIPTVTPTTTTTYNITGSFPGCPQSHDHVKVTVIQPPLIDAGPDIQSICLGAPLQLNVISNPAGTYIYNWSPSTYLNSSTIQNPIVTPGVMADVEYHVTVTTPLANCSVYDSFLLHVLPNDFTLYNPDTGICFPPSTYQIRAVGDTEFRYQWRPVIGVSDPNILTPSISPTGTTRYTITASYPNCPDMVHSVLFSVEHPEVNILTNDSTFCMGLPIPIRVSVTPADSPYVFSWSTGDNLSSSELLEPSFYTDIPGSYTYYLTITSGLGCTSVDSIKLNPSPKVDIDVSPHRATVKYGEEIRLEALNLSLATAGTLYYYWAPNDGSIANPNINNPIAVPLAPTTYTVYGMNIYGCRDSATVFVDVDYSVFDCLPTAFTPNGDGLNDVFKLCNLQWHKLVEFSVYNRWGQRLYHNVSDPGQGWDGTFNGVPQDAGVYDYMVILAKPDGSNKMYKGEVTLIR